MTNFLGLTLEMANYINSTLIVLNETHIPFKELMPWTLFWASGYILLQKVHCAIVFTGFSVYSTCILKKNMVRQSDYKLEDFETCGQPSVEKLSDAPWAIGGDTEAEMVESCMGRRISHELAVIYVWDKGEIEVQSDRWRLVYRVPINSLYTLTPS